MLIQGMVTIQDLNAPSGQMRSRPLRSCLLSKKVNDDYYVSVKNSMYPNCISYKATDLEQLHCKFIEEGKLGLRFKQPMHLILVKTEDKTMLKMFLRQIKDIISGKKVVIGTRNMPKIMPPKKNVNRFDPGTFEFVAIDRFDKRIMNMKQLNKLVLENCTLSSLPLEMGHLPISYLSLTGSTLSTLRHDQDIFWDWMTIDTVDRTLKTLKMDSIGLENLPFEIKFLKNLETLSVAKNKLTYIPQYMGELKKLRFLFVADNNLKYFPDSLFIRTFKELDISNNMFMESESLDFDHISAYMRNINTCNIKKSQMLVVKDLSHLAFASVVENCINLKRQEIPRTLWPKFDVVGRCIHCYEFVLPEYSVVQHTIATPCALKLIKNHTTNSIPWQSIICRFKCTKSSRL